MVASLQQGIYHARGQRPGPAFSILFLRADRHLDAPEVGRAFGSLWEMYQGLARGVVRDLPDHPVPHGDLSVLVGYGRNVFDLAGVRRRQPPNLKEFGLFRSPLTTGGGPLLIGGGLRYASDVRTNPATEDIAVQFIGANQLAVRRAIVETWKLLHDTIDPAIDAPPLQLTGFYTGFQRDDGRSWIDFHDGVSNMRSEERLGAIAAKRSPEPADRWMEGGTYLVFIRLAVDLLAWRRLDRAQQEMLVGRDKLSGCSLVAIGPDGTSVAEQGCPVSGTREIIDSGNEMFRDAPMVADEAVRRSHVQRANHHVEPASAPNSLRVFRQGYEFMEAIDRAPGFEVGLNFVSFQDTPERLFRMLTQQGWLGRVNFGGHEPGDSVDPGASGSQLLSVRAAAVYVVPPVVDGEPFPGAGVFL